MCSDSRQTAVDDNGLVGDDIGMVLLVKEDRARAAFRGAGTISTGASQPSSDVDVASSSSDARMAMQAPTRLTFLVRIS